MAKQPKVISDVSDWFVDKIVSRYLSSDDFNGYDWSFRKEIAISVEALKEIVRPLIAEGRISGRYGEFETNPFIKRMPDQTVEKELKMLDAASMELAMLYPTNEEMKGRVRAGRFPGRPYTLQLARGCAQLEQRFFDSVVLEQYRNDPRYRLQISDVGGSIYCSGGEHDREADEVALNSFGYAYDEDMNRVVAVPIRYLNDLSREHQHLWKARELEGEYQLHPDYVCVSFYGFLPDYIQVIDAILVEMNTINEICGLIGKQKLFKRDYWEPKPSGLTYIIRSTAREFYSFVHLLDKVISENIDKEFFKGEIQFLDEKVRNDGKIEVVPKGTLRLLEEWFRKNYRDVPGYPILKMMAPFKEVRKLRQVPAHGAADDVFDRTFFRKQRQLLADVYSSMRGFRQLMGEHPKPLEYEMIEPIRKGLIRTY